MQIKLTINSMFKKNLFYCASFGSLMIIKL